MGRFTYTSRGAFHVHVTWDVPRTRRGVWDARVCFTYTCVLHGDVSRTRGTFASRARVALWRVTLGDNSPILGTLRGVSRVMLRHVVSAEEEQKLLRGRQNVLLEGNVTTLDMVRAKVAIHVR